MNGRNRDSKLYLFPRSSNSHNLEFGRLARLARLLGPKVAPGVCEQLDHSLNLSTGQRTWLKLPIPVLNDLTRCHAGLPFVGTGMKTLLVVPCGVLWKIDGYSSTVLVSIDSNRMAPSEWWVQPLSTLFSVFPIAFAVVKQSLL